MSAFFALWGTPRKGQFNQLNQGTPPPSTSQGTLLLAEPLPVRRSRSAGLRGSLGWEPLLPVKLASTFASTLGAKPVPESGASCWPFLL